MAHHIDLIAIRHASMIQILDVGDVGQTADESDDSH